MALTEQTFRKLGIAIVLFSCAIVIITFIAFGATIRSKAAAAAETSDQGLSLDNVQNLVLEYTSAARIQAYMRNLTTGPHLAGTQEGYDSGKFIADKFKAFGIEDVEYLRYDVLLNYPLEHVLTMARSPRDYSFDLEEPPVFGDTPTYNPNTPAYAAFSPSGSVVGEVVYCNYGRVEDFKYVVAQLKQHNLTANGKIALVRYGKLFRGTKADFAAQFGFVGMLLYSDPADDGDKMGQVYINGPWRPDFGVQRGSFLQITKYPGDPRTPGVASKPGVAATADPNKILPTIPVQPISSKNAFPFLWSLQGGIPIKDQSWQGGLGIEYFMTGSSPVIANLTVRSNSTISPIWNIVATIPGTTLPNEWVIIGCHRDAWTFGAVDPISGSASMMESAQVFGRLLAAGWKPKRTIKIISWDAEEFGLMGSTEYVEEFSQQLTAQAVAYFNVDLSGIGSTFSADATPSLHSFLRKVAGLVPDESNSAKNNSKNSVLDFWKDQKNPEKAIPNPFGSGSDYTAFVHHLGIPGSDVTFLGAYGVYHSLYDSFTWFERFGDYKALVATSQLLTLQALVLSESTILPFNATDISLFLLRELDTLKTNLRNNDCDDSTTAAAAIAASDVSPLTQAISSFVTAEVKFSSLVAQLTKDCESGNNVRTCTTNNINNLNDRFRLMERSFIVPSGLPSRPWYKNVLFAPSIRNGYSSSVFPWAMDATYLCSVSGVVAGIKITADTIATVTAVMEKFTLA